MKTKRRARPSWPRPPYVCALFAAYACAPLLAAGLLLSSVPVLPLFALSEPSAGSLLPVSP